MDKLKLKLIVWKDSFGCAPGWQMLSDLPKNTRSMVCYSVGWEVYRDDDTIVLAPHMSDAKHDGTDQQVAGVITIPVCSIQKETDIKMKGLASP